MILSAGMLGRDRHARRLTRRRGWSTPRGPVRSQDHASRQITADLARKADHIIAMTGDHLESLLENVPEVSPRTRLLHPEGDDVADPVGADRDTYLQTARAIETYLEALLDDLAIGARPS